MLESLEQNQIEIAGKTASSLGDAGEGFREDYRGRSFDDLLFGPGFDSPHLHIKPSLETAF